MPYEPNDVEQKIYRRWAKSGFFNPDKLPKRNRAPFCILMPPPNANDPLHVGHAVFVTLQDIMIRYQRMRGKKALWLPGEDHAGFETQVVYEKKLERQGRSRFGMSREAFYKEVWDYTQKNRAMVRAQLERLGASCDWSRDTFTLDANIVKTVYATFKKMVDDGLIYRGERLVNYCTKHQTAFSELEINHETRTDPLYYMKYGPITLATVRPETKFGDTAIAVHPDDARYERYIGKTLEVETLLGTRSIKVIADESVDPTFGTGAVKVTPAHDFNDFEIWQRHKTEIPGPVQAIGRDGKLTALCGSYAGLRVEEAREKVARDMQDGGLIEKIDPSYTHTVAVCYKCKRVIEPMLMKQWFVKVAPLAKAAIAAVRQHRITIIPRNYEKIYFHWMRNIKDWNISRQNWWGIAIPAWRCLSCSKGDTEQWVITNGKTPARCTKCGGNDLAQDQDVFDTWFSSGQWPFATLNYPAHKDFKAFYPTSIMETAWDILFFWVARMIMLGIYRTGRVPFRIVYLHGLVRDKDRQKMSKSKGNVIDPLGVADLYGADALRMALTVGNMPGRDTVISEDKIRGYRNFVNKLWNITRFVLLNRPERFSLGKKPRLNGADKKILNDFYRVAKKTTAHMDAFRFSHAVETLYHYLWHRYADKIIEQSKPLLQDQKTQNSRYWLLATILSDSLKLLHPFIPFVTEELWTQLPRRTKTLLLVEPWPDNPVQISKLKSQKHIVKNKTKKI